MLEVVTAVKLHFWQGIGHTSMFRSAVRVFYVMSILITREEIHYKRINVFSVQRALHWETNWQVIWIFCYFLFYMIFSNKLDVWGAISKKLQQKCQPAMYEKNPIYFVFLVLFFFFFSKKWSDIIDNNQCRHRVLLTCFKQSNLVHKLGKYSGGSKVIDTRMDKASLELQAIDLMAFQLKLVLCLPKPCKRSMYF